MKHILGVNWLGVLCFGKCTLLVTALYRLNTKFSQLWIRLKEEKFSTKTKLKNRPMRLINMDQKFMIDVKISNIFVGVGN